MDNSDGIPQVIQSALSTHCFQPNTNHGAVICGLQAYLLPNYLLTRSDGDLPMQLHRAHKEEQRCREIRCSKKRKRRRGRQKRGCGGERNASSNVATTETRCTNDNKVASQAPGTKQKQEFNYSNKVEDTISPTDQFYYRMMARIVVAPYTSFLMDAMHESQSHSASSKRKGDPSGDVHPAKKIKKENMVTGEDTDADIERKTDVVSMVKNVYLKPNNSHEKAGNRITISPPRESLESLVDGVVGSLVQRTFSLRDSYPAKKSIASNVKRVYRRRQRKGRQRQQRQSTLNSAKKTKQNNSSVNDWLRSSNILSKGYSLGSSDTHYSSKTNFGIQNHKVRACPNMAPGVHCIKPNSITTYARSSRLMKLLHSTVGDDILTELLLNCLIFIPSVDEDTTTDSSSDFGKGNYFQLCGLPLNIVARQFRIINAGGNTLNDSDLSKDNANLEAVEKSRKRKKGTESTQHRSPKLQWNPNRPLPRAKPFYCDFYARNIGFSRSHLLNHRGNTAHLSSKNAEMMLLHAMVKLRSGGGHSSNTGGDAVFGNKRRKRWRRLRESGIAMCNEVIRRHKQCDYARLLEKNCPLLVDRNTNTHSLDVKEELSHLVTLFTPSENVVNFLEAVLRTAFPNAFWGSHHNFCQVVKTLSLFIKLRVSEFLPEKKMIEGIRILDIGWLNPHSQKSSYGQYKKKRKLSPSAHESTVVLLRNVMSWVYEQFIMPLLKSTFYITETEFTGRRVVYYRKPVWSRIKLFSLEMLMKRHYRERTVDKAKKILALHNVGCPPAPLRLLPKKTGIRAIAMLSKASGIKDNRSAHTSPISSSAPNKILKSAFQALKYEYKKRSLFGSGALGLTEVLPSYCYFLKALRRKYSNEIPQLYFISADIEHCYDNINQEYLYKQIRSVLGEDQYITQNHFIVHSTDRNRSIRCRWQKTTCSPANFLDITSASNSYSKQFHNSVFIDGVSFSVEKKQAIQGLLKDHIFGQMVVVKGSNGQHLLLQRKGIPQGSILSSLFCNAYFGNVEDKLFNGVFGNESMVIKGGNADDHKALAVDNSYALCLLVRIVDDFLLISTDYDTSKRFLNVLNKGVPRLGVKVNHDKTRMNFNAEMDITNTPGLNKDTRMFAWCGLYIDTKTCEIRLDGDRFSGTLATDTVIVHRLNSEGAALAKKMKDFVKPRCRQQLLFSPFVNSPETIRINFYHTCLLCAIKTMYYLKSGGGCHPKRFDFVYKIMCDVIHYSHFLISFGTSQESLQSDNGNNTAYCLTLKEALWLGRHAFYNTIGSDSRLNKLRDLFRESRDMPTANRQQLVGAAKKAVKSWSPVT